MYVCVEGSKTKYKPDIFSIVFSMSLALRQLKISHFRLVENNKGLRSDLHASAFIKICGIIQNQTHKSQTAIVSLSLLLLLVVPEPARCSWSLHGRAGLFMVLSHFH
jgi:hypothetical protein